MDIWDHPNCEQILESFAHNDNFGNEQGSIKSTDLEKIMVYHQILEKHFKTTQVPMKNKPDVTKCKDVIRKCMVSLLFFSKFHIILTLLQHNLGISEDAMSKVFSFYSSVVVLPRVWDYLVEHHSMYGETSPITYGKFASSNFRKLPEEMMLELFSMVDAKTITTNGIFLFYFIFDFLINYKSTDEANIMAAAMVFRHVTIKEFNTKFTTLVGTTITPAQQSVYNAFHEQISSAELDFMQTYPGETTVWIGLNVEAAVSL